MCPCAHWWRPHPPQPPTPLAWPITPPSLHAQHYHRHHPLHQRDPHMRTPAVGAHAPLPWHQRSFTRPLSARARPRRHERGPGAHAGPYRVARGAHAADGAAAADSQVGRVQHVVGGCGGAGVGQQIGGKGVCAASRRVCATTCLPEHPFHCLAGGDRATPTTHPQATPPPLPRHSAHGSHCITHHLTASPYAAYTHHCLALQDRAPGPARDVRGGCGAPADAHLAVGAAAGVCAWVCGASGCMRCSTARHDLAKAGLPGTPLQPPACVVRALCPRCSYHHTTAAAPRCPGHDQCHHHHVTAAAPLAARRPWRLRWHCPWHWRCSCCWRGTSRWCCRTRPPLSTRRCKGLG